MKYDDYERQPVKKRRPVEDAPRASSRDAAYGTGRPAKKRSAAADRYDPADEPRYASSAPRKRPTEAMAPANRRAPRDTDAASYRPSGGSRRGEPYRDDFYRADSDRDDLYRNDSYREDYGRSASRSASKPRTASRAKGSGRPVADPDVPPIKRPKKRAQGASAREKDYLYAQDEYEIRVPRGKSSQRAKKEDKKTDKPQRSGFFNVMFYAVIAVVLALTLSLVLRSTTFEVVRVSGDAMFKALAEGDLVLCTKFDYKNRGNNPERYSVALVHSQSGVMLRRVVGLPGETVQITDTGDVVINSLALPESYVELRDPTPHPEITLDPARYYVLCDNRTVTADSREYGPVTKDQLSRARFIIWPLNRIGRIKSSG